MKTTRIQVNKDITVYILNHYKCFAIISNDQLLNSIKKEIEDKLQSEILMVRFDERLNVIEFYIIGNEATAFGGRELETNDNA